MRRRGQGSAGERVGGEVALVSGDEGPRGEKRRAGERGGAPGGARRPRRGGAASAVRAAAGSCGRSRSCRSRLPGGRPCWTLGGQVGSSWVGERR